MFGDRWTLLIVRDLALGPRRSYSELLEAGEGISTNILADRLALLEARGLVEKRPAPHDRRRHSYHLTEAGKDLLPVLVEIILWGAEHDPEAGVPQAFVEKAHADRDGLIRSLRAALDDE